MGTALFQCTAEGEMEPLGFKSRKFSAQAARWDMYKKEAFAVYEGARIFFLITSAVKTSSCKPVTAIFAG